MEKKRKSHQLEEPDSSLKQIRELRVEEAITKKKWLIVIPILLIILGVAIGGCGATTIHGTLMGVSHMSISQFNSTNLTFPHVYTKTIPLTIYVGTNLVFEMGSMWLLIFSSTILLGFGISNLIFAIIYIIEK